MRAASVRQAHTSAVKSGPVDERRTVRAMCSASINMPPGLDGHNTTPAAGGGRRVPVSEGRHLENGHEREA
ncbi:hypothetical protein GCM10009662_10830 [Catellatospora coxensis]|uniref:Uncharacterized protein n=1 Tax=Catellatospora coxensis TaxID=310354 RepID=A0A8J3KQ94_9ACTN|nr:hypothetical protein Cco03nite_38070 [Catellatospora coxensis]